VIIKILTVALALSGLRRALVRWRRGASLTLEFLFWGIIWSGVGIVVFVPHVTDRIAYRLGVSSGFNVLVFASILGLLFAVYRLLVRTKNLERDLTLLVRREALASAETVQPTNRNNG
jgi:hypothetical protein